MKSFFFIFFFVLIGTTSSCTNKYAGTPLSAQKMENLIYDYHMAQAVANQSTDSINIRKRLLMDALLKKYQLTPEEFDSVLSWYAAHPKEFAEVYTAVEKRFSSPSSNNSATDTTKNSGGENQKSFQNVWQGSSTYLLSVTGRTFATFSFPSKITIKKGDILHWRMSATWLYRSGLKSVTIALSLVYNNDSISSRTITISTTGEITLSIPVEGQEVKLIRGFIQQNAHSGEGIKLLYLNNFTLDLEKYQLPNSNLSTTSDSSSIENKELQEKRLQDSLLSSSQTEHFQ